MAAKKTVVEKVFDISGEFVLKQGGEWGHTDWESYLKKAAKAGADTDDEAKRHLGNILEAAKYLYRRAGISPEPKAATAKKAVKKPAKKKAAAKKSTPKKAGKKD